LHPLGKYTLITSSLSNKSYVDRLVLGEFSIIHCQDKVKGVRDTFSKIVEPKVGLVGGGGVSINLS
jgi:hypothetical protein